MLKKIKEKYNTLPLSMKASIWFVLCGFLKDVTDILATPIFTRILTAEQYGVYNVYNSWFQIFKIIFTLYLFSDVFNVGLVKFEEKQDAFISATLGFTTSVTGFFFVLFLIYPYFWERVLDLPEFMIFLLFIQVLSYVPYHCWMRRERFVYRYWNTAVVSSLYVLLQPALGILAIYNLNMSINPGYTRIIAAVLVQFVIGVALYTGMMRRGKTFFHKGYWKYSLKTGFLLIPYNLSKIVLNQSDRIMINYFSGKSDTGIYSVAHSAAFVIQVIMDGLNGAFVPWLYKKFKKKDYEGIASVVNILIFLASCGALAIAVIAPEVMKILADSGYYEGVYCIPSLACSVYLIFVYTLFSDIELFYGKNGYVTVASTIGAVINIFLNAAFIPMYGFIAAGYTTFAGYAVMCLGHYFFMKGCLRDAKVEANKIYNIKIIVCISIVLFVLSLVCIVLYEHLLLRTAMFATLAFGVFLFRNQWIKICREVKKIG